MDKKVKTFEQLRTLQELFPLHIISLGALNQHMGWESNTTNLDFKFDNSLNELVYYNYDHISIYLEPEDLLYDIRDNLDILDHDKIVDISTDNFDIQHDILDGIFQAIRILNSLQLGQADAYSLQACKVLVTQFLRVCRDNDKEDDFLFNTLLREISNGEWRSNVYFDKL